MSNLPKIVAPPLGNYSINKIRQAVGKTIQSVEIGTRESRARLHESEAVILRFTDGTSLGIDTGSNVQNVAGNHKGMNEQEFNVDFMMTWE